MLGFRHRFTRPEWSKDGRFALPGGLMMVAGVGPAARSDAGPQVWYGGELQRWVGALRAVFFVDVVVLGRALWCCGGVCMCGDGDD